VAAHVAVLFDIRRDRCEQYPERILDGPIVGVAALEAIVGIARFVCDAAAANSV
jgi:hypothetical protein